MLVSGFEIQIVQLPLKFIFNNPPLHQQKSNKTNSARQNCNGKLSR